jgi:GR25 family glycosyltransferase involved in LPS biosynthesis
MSSLGLERIVVIEDDVSFKPEWSVYNQLLFDQTPDDFDIVYLGGEAHQDTSLLVARIPISGLYGYIITAAGARKLATLVKDHDDSAVVKKMYRALLSNERTLSWYVFGQPLITKN